MIDQSQPKESSDRFWLLNEECGKVIQSIAKVVRLGDANRPADNSLSNADILLEDIQALKRAITAVESDLNGPKATDKENKAVLKAVTLSIKTDPRLLGLPSVRQDLIELAHAKVVGRKIPWPQKFKTVHDENLDVMTRAIDRAVEDGTEALMKVRLARLETCTNAG